MRLNLKTIIILLVLFALSIFVVYLFNASAVAKATTPHSVVTPETFTDTKNISAGDVIEITGTPDLLNAVSMEDRNTNNALLYYVPLKEYGVNFVVEIKKSKLRTESQTFTGTVEGLTNTEFGTRIRNSLNKPVELSDADRGELDSETINILTDQTTNEFTSKTLIVQDGKIPDPGSVYANIIFWATLLFAAIVTLFRRFIFN